MDNNTKVLTVKLPNNKSLRLIAQDSGTSIDRKEYYKIDLYNPQKDQFIAGGNLYIDVNGNEYIVSDDKKVIIPYSEKPYNMGIVDKTYQTMTKLFDPAYQTPNEQVYGEKIPVKFSKESVEKLPELKDSFTPALQFAETYSLPPEYVNALVQMSKGQMGNNHFKRQVVAGDVAPYAKDVPAGDRVSRSTTNFLGAITQAASESLANNLQKAVSGELGKAEFWSKVVPALEAATGRKITGLSKEKQDELKKQYEQKQLDLHAMGKPPEPLTDEEMKTMTKKAFSPVTVPENIKDYRISQVDEERKNAENLYIQERLKENTKLEADNARYATMQDDLKKIEQAAINPSPNELVANQSKPSIINNSNLDKMKQEFEYRVKMAMINNQLSTQRQMEVGQYLIKLRAANNEMDAQSIMSGLQKLIQEQPSTTTPATK